MFYKEDLQAERLRKRRRSGGRPRDFGRSRPLPDLVVLDIRLPGMDGLDAMGRMLNKNPRVPIVLNTGCTSDKENFLS